MKTCGRTIYILFDDDHPMDKVFFLAPAKRGRGILLLHTHTHRPHTNTQKEGGRSSYIYLFLFLLYHDPYRIEIGYGSWFM
jgi:hypothetical protein